MEEKLSGRVAVPDWKLFCLPPSKTWSTGLTPSSFCSFSYSELVYLIHSVSKLPPRAAPTTTGATFSCLESVLFFSYTIPHAAKRKRSHAGRSNTFHQPNRRSWQVEWKNVQVWSSLGGSTCPGLCPRFLTNQFPSVQPRPSISSPIYLGRKALSAWFGLHTGTVLVVGMKPLSL